LSIEAILKPTAFEMPAKNNLAGLKIRKI